MLDLATNSPWVCYLIYEELKLTPGLYDVIVNYKKTNPIQPGQFIGIGPM